MSKKRKPLKCAHCGTPFKRTPMAGLFCGDGCKNGFAEKHAELTEQMKAAGFTQHTEAPNLWIKDGVAIGIEHVKAHGFIKAIRRHTSAVAEHAAKTGSANV